MCVRVCVCVCVYARVFVNQRRIFLSPFVFLSRSSLLPSRQDGKGTANPFFSSTCIYHTRIYLSVSLRAWCATFVAHPLVSVSRKKKQPCLLCFRLRVCSPNSCFWFFPGCFDPWMLRQCNDGNVDCPGSDG